MTIRRSGTRKLSHGRNHMLFAEVHDGRVYAVVSAASLGDAEYAVSRFRDATQNAHRKAQGFRVVPCMVEWEDEE